MARALLATQLALVLSLWLVACVRASMPLNEFAECLANDDCVEAEYLDVSATRLAPGQPVIAVCVAGTARTWTMQAVYEAVRDNVVTPMAPVQTDFFFALGKAPLEYRPATREGWLASFAAFRVVGGSLHPAGDQRVKLDACFAQIQAAEVASGHNYTHVFRLRTDMLFLRPVPSAIATTNVTLFQYDIVGLCPRAAVSAAWPCDVPNSAHDTRMPGGFQADPDTGRTFQVSFERVNAPITQMERHFEWMAWFRDGLAEHAQKKEPAEVTLRNILMNFYASMCWKYDWHLHNYIYYQVTTNKDFVPEYAPTCPADKLASSPWMAALAVVGKPAEFAEALKRLDFGPIVGHYVQHADAPRGPNPQFDSLCGCRWAVCGQKATAGLPEHVVAFTQGLCRRHFTTPLNARQYYYHPPALHPQFDERDFLASEEDSALFPHAPRNVVQQAPAVSGAVVTRPLRVAVLVVGNFHETVQHAVSVESLRARLQDVYRREGHTVDTFVCEKLVATNRAVQMVMGRLKPYTEHDVQADNQFDRNELCFKEVLKTHLISPYEWYVHVRPDLVLWEDMPALETLDANVIHARLLSAQNIGGLTQAHFSYAWDDPTCNAAVCMPGSCATNCTVYDDQLAIVPAAQAEAYFDAAEHSQGLNEAFECQLTRNGFPEGYFTRDVQRGGGVFKPLALEARLFMYKGDVPDPAAAGVMKTC
jgi:hypothetical protein